MTPPALLGDGSLPATIDGATGGTINLVQVMLSAITHHWWKMLAIWVVLTAGLAYAVHVRVKPLYETFSLLRVEPSHQDLFNLGMGSAEVFHHFLVTQVQLFTSPNVLVAAQSNRNVAATEIVKNAKDPETELRGRLQVGVVPETYLIRVAMTSPKPEEASVIINEVVNAYLEVANAWSNDKNKYEIGNLKSYNAALSDKVKEKQNEWLQLAGSANIELIEPPKSHGGSSNLPEAAPDRVTVDEYKRVRQSLFEISMGLIEAEALLHTRKGEPEALAAGVDPEQLIERRIEDTLRADPEVVALLQQIEVASHQKEQVARLSRRVSDPSLVTARNKVSDLQDKLRSLCIRKRKVLDARFHEQGAGIVDEPLAELLAHIESLRTRKSSYEKLLSKIEVTNRQEGTDAVKVALVREELNSLKGMQDSVQKRVEQLEFDSRGEARISRITPGTAGRGTRERRPPQALDDDPGRRPCDGTGSVPFPGDPLRSGRRPRGGVATGPGGGLSGAVTARHPTELPTSGPLRNNELQLQEFLQSLDHLRFRSGSAKRRSPGSAAAWRSPAPSAARGRRRSPPTWRSAAPRPASRPWSSTPTFAGPR